MAIGYTISPLDSNESILEKLNKLEKYLKDNKMYNLYTTSFEFYNTTDNIIPDASIDNIALNTISVGDLMLYKYNGATVVGTVIAVGTGVYTVDRTTEKVLFDDTQISSVTIVQPESNKIKIEIVDTKGNLFESNIVTIAGGGGGSGISTIQVNESSGTATIVITDTDNVQHTSNSFTVGEQNTDTLIDTITVTESNGTATITITDTANNSYTSNSFNVGGAETVYVDSDDNVVSSTATLDGVINNSVVLGTSEHAGGAGVCIGYNNLSNGIVTIGSDLNTNNGGCIAIGYKAEAHEGGIAIGNTGTTVYDATIATGQTIAIGYGAVADKANISDPNLVDSIALGYEASVNVSNAVQLCQGSNTTPDSIQYKSHQIVSEEGTTLKLSNELQLNNHLITIISMTNDFATASANGIQVTVDQDDSTHEQVQNLNHPTTDTSILEDEQVLAIYNYTDMTDPDNPVSEFTLCYAMFVNYDSVNNVCDCMVLRMGPTQTM